MNPSTGTENRPDAIAVQNESTIFVLELSVGFETNSDLNTKWKANKYKEMLKSLKNKFEKVNFKKYGGLGYSWSSQQRNQRAQSPWFPTTGNSIFD